MQKIAKKLSLVMVALLTVFTFLSYMPAKAAVVVPKVQYVSSPKLEYTAGDRVQFNLNAPNYGGRVQYRVVLWNNNTKSYSDLWNTADKYYTNWQPYGNETFTLGWPIFEPGTYRITIYAKRAGVPNSQTALKGYNCDSYMESAAFVVKAKDTATIESIAPVADVTVNEGATAVLPTEVTVNMSDDTTKTAKVTWGAVDTTKVGTVAIQGTVEGTDKKATVNVVVKAVALEVKSINAINAKQLVAVFNKAVDETTAEDITNYAIKIAGQAAVPMTASTGANDATAVVSEDGKTVTITLSNALTSAVWGSIAKNDAFLVQVSDVEDANGTVMKDASVSVVYAGDSVAPIFVSASAKAKTFTSNVTLTFNEPVDFSQAVVNVNGYVASLSAGTSANEVVATIGSNLAAGSTYRVSLINFKDASGNLMNPNPIDSTVTVTADTTAPVVTEVKVVRDNLIQVKFDKAMNIGTLTTSSIRLFDLNYNNTLAVSGITAADATNKVFNVALTSVAFNAANTFSGVLSVSNTAADTLGNVLASPVSKNVTISKDVTAPQIVSSRYIKDTTYNTISTTNGAIIVKFNEEINVGSGVYQVVNNLGGVVSTPFGTIAVNPNDATELVLPLSAGVASTVSSYMVLVPAGAVTDKSVSANSNAAANLFVNVTAGAPVTSDTTAPVVSSVAQTAAINATSGTTIAITLNETGSGLDLATVVNTNNYRIDGAPVPAGTYVTVSGTTATLHIPAGSFASDKTYAFNINGIKDLAGNTITPYVSSFILNDDVRPVMTSATLNTDGSVSLGFSEVVNSAATAGTVNDFVVTLDGSVVNASRIVLADGTGSDAGKYVLKVQNISGSGFVDLNTAITLSVSTASSPAAVKDASTNTNVIKADTTIVVK